MEVFPPPQSFLQGPLGRKRGLSSSDDMMDELFLFRGHGKGMFPNAKSAQCMGDACFGITPPPKNKCKIN